jgi:ribonuclease BN (tRNA processing enzyme)
MKPPFWPIRFSDLRADIRCRDITTPGFITRSGISVETFPLNHPGGATGFRIQYGGRNVIYICDHEHVGEKSGLTYFCADADLIIYDAFATKDEYDSGRYNGWGHSHHESGIILAESVGAGRIALTHHAPWRTDDELDALAEKVKTLYAGACIAYEGMTIEI